MTTEEWYKVNNCDHVHCPCKCDHPQPFMFGDDLYCGQCAICDNFMCKMIPCKPEICE